MHPRICMHILRCIAAVVATVIAAVMTAAMTADSQENTKIVATRCQILRLKYD